MHGATTYPHTSLQTRNPSPVRRTATRSVPRCRPLGRRSGSPCAMRDDLPAEFLLDGFPPAIRDTGRALRSLISRDRPGLRRGGPRAGAGSPTRCRRRAGSGTSPGSGRSGSTSISGSSTGRCSPTRSTSSRAPQERLRKFRYLTFEPAIDIDEAILVDYLRRAAELAVMPSAARRALARDALAASRSSWQAPRRRPAAIGSSCTRESRRRRGVELNGRAPASLPPHARRRRSAARPGLRIPPEASAIR